VRFLRMNRPETKIAGIDGTAIGAGLSLAMCADMRTASSGARFHPGSARIGTSPDAGLTWTRPATIGHERALRFALQPRAGLVPLPATHMGCLVNRIGVPADLEAHLRDEPRFAERG
jgi:enoyl-CoA hydratase/carnithine racemase